MKLNDVGWIPGRRRRVLRCHTLDTDSAYRVIAKRGATVEVEVLNAPGLRPGTRLHITAAAAQAMRRHQTSHTNERAARLAGVATRFVVARSPRLKLPTA
jgi:hypothetical protein